MIFNRFYQLIFRYHAEREKKKSQKVKIILSGRSDEIKHLFPNVVVFDGILKQFSESCHCCLCVMKLSSYTQPQVLTHLRSCVTWPAWLWRVVAGRRRPQSVCRTAGTHSVPSVPGWRSGRCVCPSLRWHRLPVRQTPRPLYPPHARTWFPCRPLETPGSELCVYAEWSVTKISNGLKIIRYWNLSDTARFTNYYFTYNKSINYKINHIFF